MAEQLFPLCEYCYLNKFDIVKNCEVVDEEGNLIYKVKLICQFDLKDGEKMSIKERPSITISSYVHEAQEMISDVDMWNIWPSVIQPGIDCLVAATKLEYARYTM